MIETRTKENLLNLISLLIDKEVSLTWTFLQNRMVASILADGKRTTIEVGDLDKCVPLNIRKLNISSNVKMKCFDLMQFIVENNLYFIFANRPIPVIRLTDKLYIDYYIDVYADSYRFKKHLFLVPDTDELFHKKLSFNEITTLIKNFILDDID